MKTTYPTHPIRNYNEWITAVYNSFRMTAAEYVRNKNIRIYTRFIIKPDGKGYYIVDEKEIPEQEFKAQFPLPLMLLRNSENPDTTIAYLNENI